MTFPSSWTDVEKLTSLARVSGDVPKLPRAQTFFGHTEGRETFFPIVLVVTPLTENERQRLVESVRGIPYDQTYEAQKRETTQKLFGVGLSAELFVWAKAHGASPPFHGAGGVPIVIAEVCDGT